MGEYILRLDEVNKYSGKTVGGKAANLGEMVGAGLPVPPGFVVTTKAFMRFLDSNQIRDKIESLLRGVDTENVQQLNEASFNITNLMLRAQMPDYVRNEIAEAYEELSVGKDMKDVGGKALDLIRAGRGQSFVAVRSSATSEDLASASFAGQLESILSVQGREQLCNAVKRCWSSLFTPRVIFYRKDRGFTEFPEMGVVVQRMVESEKAGVMFTVNPVNGNTEQLMIEATWGYGESLVSGLVTPDDYLIEKSTGKVLKKTIGKKKWIIKMNQLAGSVGKEKLDKTRMEAEVLTEPEVRRLWELGKMVEMHYGKPQDIEWAAEKGRIYLVQSRPVTTIGMPHPHEIAARPEPEGKVILQGAGASPGRASGKVVIVSGHEDMGKVHQGDILVTKMTSPAMVPLMKRAAAIVTDDGGKTCHAAIVSRELGIPCIVGTDIATSVLRDGQMVTVDAVHGKVYDSPGGSQAPQEPAEEQEYAHAPGEYAGESAAHAPQGGREHVVTSFITSDRITATDIKVNLAFPESLDSNPDIVQKADGVGLLRAEHMLTESGKHPAHLAKSNPEELTEIIKAGLGKIAKAFYPKRVWYRTLDARTDEFKELEGGEDESQEANPMLGWHGIRRSIDEQDVFRCELAAIKRLREEGLDNIEVMLPFVISVEEVRKAKEIMKEVGLEARLGVMVETPAACMVIEQICSEGIVFISIGSNDLTQLVLGIDRGNAKISRLYSEFHPAVMEMMKHVIRTCKKRGVETSICGEAGSNPKMAEMLVSAGIDSISAEADAIDEIRSTVARAERRMLLERVRKG